MYFSLISAHQSSFHCPSVVPSTLQSPESWLKKNFYFDRKYLKPDIVQACLVLMLQVVASLALKALMALVLSVLLLIVVSFHCQSRDSLRST